VATRDYCWIGVGSILGSFTTDGAKRKQSCDQATDNKAYRAACYRGAGVA
jgi:hypothetical protein